MSEPGPHVFGCVGRNERHHDRDGFGSFTNGRIIRPRPGVDRLSQHIDKFHHARDRNVEPERLHGLGCIVQGAMGCLADALIAAPRITPGR